MMVIFTSQSEKKAILTVRRILDCFANRIGQDVWQTVITEDGLQAVHAVLRRNATKDMSVSCRWIRSRNYSELLWIVGNRRKFNTDGFVPVNTTQKNILHHEWENDWQYFSLLKAFVAMAALFHDWGKANSLFQKKLFSKGKPEADPLRHEWLSCKLIEALVTYSSDDTSDFSWLTLLIDHKVHDNDVISMMKRDKAKGTLKTLPPLARLLTWTILSHHRLPSIAEKNERLWYYGQYAATYEDVLKYFNSTWGYANQQIAENSTKWKKCFSFPNGCLLDASSPWLKEVTKWARRLLKAYDDVQNLFPIEKREKALPLFLTYVRLCLMLGDYYISSLPPSSNQENKGQWINKKLWANTDGTGKGKQYLEEHLVTVMKKALQILHQLPRFEGMMERTYDVKALNRPSLFAFRWQDKAVRKIKDCREEHKGKIGWFIINMASTGCGKTFANAKMMKALSDDGKSLRYNLALGLRSLTLQTGDEYRERIGLSETDLAVIIGSTAVRELHDEAYWEHHADDASMGKIDELFEDELAFQNTANSAETDFLNIFFHTKRPALDVKNKALFYKPVLVSTIDHLIGATETKRGGRYMLPMLRLASSDLVIDEIDDFAGDDLIAIARLIHLAGMLGRNVIISSATVPPDLAEGLFRAYETGLNQYNAFFAEPKDCFAAFCDEFKCEAAFVPSGAGTTFETLEQSFISHRVAHLEKQQVRRKGYIASCERKPEILAYFERMKDEMLRLHDANCFIDKKTKKNVSIGMVRLANIQPCVALSLYLLRCALPPGYAVRVLTYHSRQTLLLRHEEEKYLDRALKRKYAYAKELDITDEVIKAQLKDIVEENVFFVLVTTPVEEIGRDHDFDWAVVEPSSYRSIIQLSGRILRHRKMEIDVPTYNIAIMQYNIRSLYGEKIAFCYPGYESKAHTLDTHDVTELIPEKKLQEKIDAIPRIQKHIPLDPAHRLIDLEHRAMEGFQGKGEVGPNTMNGWIQEYWWMTALPQLIHPFREQTQQERKICLVYDGESDDFDFCERDGDQYKVVTKLLGIRLFENMTSEMEQRLWLHRNYKQALLSMIGDENAVDETSQLERLSKRYGEVTITESKTGDTEWYYDDQLGLFKAEIVIDQKIEGRV